MLVLAPCRTDEHAVGIESVGPARKRRLSLFATEDELGRAVETADANGDALTPNPPMERPPGAAPAHGDGLPHERRPAPPAEWMMRHLY